MPDGDPYPSNTPSTFYQPEVPVERLQAEAEERHEAAQIMPVVDDLIAWFDKLIADCDSIKVARTTAKEEKTGMDVTTLAYDIARKVFEVKRSELKGKKDTFGS